MKPITTVLLSGLLVSGCVHRHAIVVESSPEPEVYGEEEVYADDETYADDDSTFVEECEPVWDGHAFVVLSSHIHGSGCGHWYHHWCWHLFPETHVYLEFGYSWCGDTGGFFFDGEPCGRVWDGWAFLFLRGHVHGVGCGHYYHHGCWNTCAKDYVYVQTGYSHFTSSPPRPRVAVLPVRVEGGHREVRTKRAAVAPGNRQPGGELPRREQAPRNPEAKQRADVRRAGQPAMRQQPQRVEQPPKREQPQHIEQPRKREQPQRVEQPPKREQPQRIEQPRKREQPRRIEQPPKREQPQRTEQPPKREQPQRIEQPQRREQAPKREAPRKQEAPKKREPEKKEPVKRK